MAAEPIARHIDHQLQRQTLHRQRREVVAIPELSHEPIYDPLLRLAPNLQRSLLESGAVAQLLRAPRFNFDQKMLPASVGGFRMNRFRRIKDQCRGPALLARFPKPLCVTAFEHQTKMSEFVRVRW